MSFISLPEQKINYLIDLIHTLNPTTWIDVISVITNIFVIVASICAVLAYIKWRREVILTRKINIIEDLYCIYLYLDELLRDLYSPMLFGMTALDLDTITNEALKDRIQAYRHSRISKNLSKYYELKARQSICKIYFELDKFFDDFSSLWTDLHCKTTESWNNRESEFYLADDYLKLYREVNANFKLIEYSNEVLEKLNKFKAQLEKIIAPLVKK